MDIRPISLPVPSLFAKNTQREHLSDETKAHMYGQSSAESSSPLPQPLRFLANSVSISVNGTSKQEQKSSEVKAGTDGEKKAETAVDTCSQRTMVASCACGTEIHLKLERLFSLSIQRRCFSEWRRQKSKRHWKKIAWAKDEQIVHLLDKLEESVGRMVMYCRKQKKRRLLRFWRGYVGFKRHQYAIEAKADAFSSLKVKSHVYRRWRMMATQGAWYRDMESHAQDQYHTALRFQCFRMWYGEIQLTHTKNLEASRMECSKKKDFLLLFLAAWKHAQRVESVGRRVKQKVDLSVKQSVFGFWNQRTKRRKKCYELEVKIDEEKNSAVLARAYRVWHSSMEKSVMSRLLRQCIFSIHMIQSLYVDNRRLASIVDSGRWGEEQIELLHAAADMLREEKQNLQSILNQFPWSRDRRLCQPRSVQSRKNSTKNVDDTSCPEVFLRLSGKLPPKTIPKEEEQIDKRTSIELSGDADAPSKAVFERLSMLSGILQNSSSGSIVTSVTTEHLSKVGDMFKLIKTVNASFETIGFSPSSVS